jgi:UDP-N-acetylglucosamine--N-acetylmuramyl-(pentapeptide) pyrophosphoryl-undecaprenol N-acetylglucosamine transferase
LNQQQKYDLIISGGGTGGHIFPALAIANAVKRLRPATNILFVGAEGRMEMEKIPQAGYPIVGLPIAGIQRSLSLKNLFLPIRVPQSLFKANSILKKNKPQAVVGVGGYASGPILFMASARKIPTVIQEQNSYAGITNKLLGKWVNAVCVAYDGMEKFFPKKKIIETGNPVRNSLINSESKRNEALQFFGLNPNKKVLLCIGGSLGARSINESIAQHLKQLYDADVEVLWQTGKIYFESFAKEAKPYDRIHVFEFIDRMDLAYAAADVVISRAGAISISELCVVKKASVLVPSPNVAEDHQTKNAMALVKKNAALMIEDREAVETLVSTALSLLKDEKRCQQLRENIAALAKPYADETIAKVVIELMNHQQDD